MASTRTWLKTVSGALCALLLLVFTVAPAVDALVCGSENAPTVSAHVAVGEAVASPDHADKAAHGKAGAETCAHGHCHHAAPAAPAVGATFAFKAILPPTLTPEAGGVPPSNTPDGPEEPPRA
jgi:hypothetical protein